MALVLEMFSRTNTFGDSCAFSADTGLVPSDGSDLEMCLQERISDTFLIDMIYP
jgi:hypothetical protein